MTIHAEAGGRTTATERIVENGTTERIAFRGAPGSRIFSCLYLPASAPLGAVLICPPLLAEFTKNYRREVMLARRLAAEGYAVARFHYRGTGNSDGESRDLVFDTMRDDTAASLEQLLEVSGSATPFIIGTRWSALIAAATAASRPDAGLVMWEPVLEASRFFREAFRTRLMVERKGGVDRPATGAELTERLRAGESVDVAGYRIEPELYATLAGLALDDQLGQGPRAMLVTQIGGLGSPRPDLAAAVDRWRSAGSEVDVHVVKGDEAWWLVDERGPDEGHNAVSIDLIDSTAAWISARTNARRA